MAVISELQGYGKDCLRSRNGEVKDALIRRHIPPDKVPPLERAYGIVVKLNDNLAVDRVRGYLEKQIDAIAQFLTAFHIGIFGQPTRLVPLYEVAVIVEKRRKLKISFDLGTLTLYLPYGKLRSRYWDEEYLKTAWHQGKHLKNYYPRSLRQLWWLFDPIGAFRFNLRSMVVLAVQKQILGIDRILMQISAPEPEKQGNQSEFKTRAIAFLKQSVREDKLGIDLNVALNSYGDRALLQILKQYKENLRDPHNIEEILDAGSFILQDTLTKEESRINIKMLGFVNVGNYHRIDVELHLSFGYLRKYIEVIPRQTEVKALQLGFVNVYTIDDITVKPNLHTALKLDLETAALEKTLQAFS